jgi:hypothetical protein
MVSSKIISRIQMKTFAVKKFVFDINLITVEDLISLYKHFNLVMAESDYGKVPTRKRFLSCFCDEDNESVAKLICFSALLVHDCIRVIEKGILYNGEARIFNYCSYDRFTDFDLEFTDYEVFCEDEISEVALIDNFGLRDLFPILRNYSFIRFLCNN